MEKKQIQKTKKQPTKRANKRICLAAFFAFILLFRFAFSKKKKKQKRKQIVKAK